MSDTLTLFGPAWLALALAAVALSWPGLLVVARGQAMLTIAAAQCAAAGAALAMAAIGWSGGGHVHGDWRLHAGGIAGGIAGTAAAWRGGTERAAWLFAAAGAASLLLVAGSPYGMHDLQAMQNSSALLAGPLEAGAMGVLAVAGAIAVALRHRELRLLAVDPAHARACGMDPRRWNLAIGAWLGLSVSLAVSVQGLLFAVAFLIVPTLAAGALARALWPLLILAPLIALAAGTGGIALAHRADLPPGQVAVALLALTWPLTAGLSALRRRTRTTSGKFVPP